MAVRPVQITERWQKWSSEYSPSLSASSLCKRAFRSERNSGVLVSFLSTTPWGSGSALPKQVNRTSEVLAEIRNDLSEGKSNTSPWRNIAKFQKPIGYFASWSIGKAARMIMAYIPWSWGMMLNMETATCFSPKTWRVAGGTHGGGGGAVAV